MSVWIQYLNGRKINQWNVWQRGFFLLVALLFLWIIWYFLLEKPLLNHHQAALEQQARAHTFIKELNAFLGMRANFVYQNELQAVQLQQVFQNAVSDVSTLKIKSYLDSASVALPAGGNQFAQIASVFNIPLFATIQQSSATIVFSSGFNDFVAYLKILQQSHHQIYFDRIDFTMNRYPKAQITLKVFTLGGA